MLGRSCYCLLISAVQLEANGQADVLVDTLHCKTKMESSMLNITYTDRRTNIWVRERTKLIDIIYSEKNEMVLGRAYQPPQRRPMDLARHHLETI